MNSQSSLQAAPPMPQSPLDKSERDRLIDEVYVAALNETEEDRTPFLEAACKGDEELRRAVLDRLERRNEPPDFLKMLDSAGLRPEQAGDIVGVYKLREQIGEGGFGTVWVADQEEPFRRRVALKIIKIGMDTKDLIARFELERQALAMMEHPNISKVYDAGITETGRPYFVMELVRGVKITEYCDDANLPTAERLSLFIAVCNAAQHAHQKGIIHRDLKPSNILVTLHDGVPVAKVIDFGVAKAMQPGLTEHTVYTLFNQMIGTPEYMSPEQAEMSGLDIDTRSDVYSLGIVLYELLTGRTPFDRNELMRKGIDEMRRTLRDVEPPKPSAALSTMNLDLCAAVAQHRRTEGPKLIGLLRGDLDWIVMKAIEKDRTRRYDTASGFAADIQRHLKHEPVVARPPTTIYRFRRMVRRNKATFVAGTAVFISLVAGIVASVTMAIRAEKESERTKAALAELSAAAPAIAAQARVFVIKGDFPRALEQFGYAIRLQPKEPSYRIERGNLYQSQLRMREAAADYQVALDLNPQDERAATNLHLSEEIGVLQTQPGSPPPRPALAKLAAVMKTEQRPAAEQMPIAQMLDNAKEQILNVWLERLSDLPNSTGTPLSARLGMRPDGMLTLDLSHTGVADLKALKGMPLAELNLFKCNDLHSIEPLRDMQLEVLNLDQTAVTDIAPLATLSRLEDLWLNNTDVADIKPLALLPLKVLRLTKTKVTNLEPLSKLPLTFLELNHTKITDLRPIATRPITTLDCSYTNIADLAPLASLPLEHLWLEGARVGNLAFTEGLPLKTLAVNTNREIENIRALGKVKSLEKLALPVDYHKLSDEELDGIESLRNHPGLRQITASIKSGLSFNNADSKDAFWKKWDRDIGWLRELRQGASWLSREADLSWKVVLNGLKSIDILRGANISTLHIAGCKELTDISPLKGMPLNTISLPPEITNFEPLRDLPLRYVWMSDVKVADLSPLKGAQLKNIFMDRCPNVSDLSFLAHTKTLEQVILPQSLANPSPLRGLPYLRRIAFTYDHGMERPIRSATEFWKDWEAAPWIGLLRDAKVKCIVNQGREGQWLLAIPDKNFKDLKFLKGAEIDSLELRKSGVTDLRGIEDVQVRSIRFDPETPLDVSPLGSNTTVREVVLPRQPTGVGELKKIASLERITYADGPLKDVKDFWLEYEKNNGQ